MDISKNVGKLDRTHFRLVHNETVYCQTFFEQLTADDVGPNALEYNPCWAIIDPGMTLEAHSHPMPEFYVFVSGEGTMRLNEQEFPVQNGMAVNIPPNVVHQVSNSASSIQPLIWVSVGFKVESN